MLHPLDIRKILSYTMIVFILYISSGTSDLSNSKNLAIGGWAIFTILYLYLENYIKYSFLFLLGIFGCISILYYFRNNAFNEVTYIGFFIKVSLAYYCRELCKEYFADYFVKIVSFWSAICLVLFCLQLINYDFTYNLNNIFGSNDSLTHTDDTAQVNSIIFTIIPMHPTRNSGFMWEPGAFVTVLLLTYYINIFNRKESLLSKKNIILLVSILTAQSTMGFMSLIVPFGLKLKDFIMSDRIYQQLSVVIIPLILTISIIIFTKVDLLYNKIAQEFIELDNEFDVIALGEKDDFVVQVSRSASVIIDMRTIKNYPLFGLGVDFRTVSFNKLGVSEKLATSCGSTILLLRFGFIGFFIYNYLMYKKALFDQTLHKIGWLLIVNYALFTQEFSAGSFFHLFIF